MAHLNTLQSLYFLQIEFKEIRLADNQPQLKVEQVLGRRRTFTFTPVALR